MNYVVLDLEWNQGDASKEAQNPEMPFEVIEIGAVKLDADMKNCGEYSRRIKPTCYNTMHFITAKLLHIHRADLENERCFPEVFEDFRKWCGDDFLFCTWGPQDLTELQRNMHYHGVKPFSDGPLPFLDVQKLFSLAFQSGKDRSSLESAVDMMAITKDIPFHRARDDAYYTGEILALIPEKFLSNVSYDCFSIPKDKKHEVHIEFNDYVKFISRGFSDKNKALEDPEVISTVCCICGKPLRRKAVSWFSPNGKNYYSVSICPEHGNMKVKVRLKKTDNGLTYVVKTEKFISEKDVKDLRERADKAARNVKRAEQYQNRGK